MASDQETRRAFPRRSVPNVDMFFYRASPSATPQMRKNIVSEILDISQGGARVRVSEAVNRGETVTLELRDRSSGESFRARGEVRWSVTAGLGHLLGVQFSEHYTPMATREAFTIGAAAPKTEPATRLDVRISLNTDEKRKAERFALKDYTVTLYRQGTLAPQGLKRNLGRTILDLSASGAQLEVTEPLETGSLVQLTLHLTSLSDTLDALAAVRWCRPDHSVAGAGYLTGLQFLNLGDPQRKKIEFMRKWFTKPKKK